MKDNERILAEIEARLNAARTRLEKAPDAMKPLLEYFQEQSAAGLAHVIMKDVAQTLEMWAGREIQAGGFEWYYDGSYKPEALGYIYEEVLRAPNLAKVKTIGSGTHLARKDFDGGVKFGKLISPDTGGFPVGEACFPVYECAEAELGGEEEEDTMSEFINLFTLRMFQSLHLVFRHLASRGDMKKMKLKTPAYFFANNHDWGPFLIFVYNPEETYKPLTEKGSVKVPRLKKWLDELARAREKKEDRERFLGAVQLSSPEKLEKHLFSMPEFTDADGRTETYDYKDLRIFGWTPLCDERVREKISLEALVAYFKYAISNPEANIYCLQCPITFLLLKDPKRGYEYIANYAREHEEKKETIAVCAKNCARWAKENPEERWMNPNLALKKNRTALRKMKKLGKLK